MHAYYKGHQSSSAKKTVEMGEQTEDKREEIKGSI
jgi:hypothetical protein